MSRWRTRIRRRLRACWVISTLVGWPRIDARVCRCSRFNLRDVFPTGSVAGRAERAARAPGRGLRRGAECWPRPPNLSGGSRRRLPPTPSPNRAQDGRSVPSSAPSRGRVSRPTMGRLSPSASARNANLCRKSRSTLPEISTPLNGSLPMPSAGVETHTSALTHGSRLRRGAEGQFWQHHRLGCQPHTSQTAAFFGREGRPPYRLSFTSLTNSGICRNLANPDVSQKTPSRPRKPAFLSR